MKKSARVNLAFLSSFAAGVMNAFGGDGGDWVEAKRCVNPDNVVVEDRWCEDQSTRPSGHGGGFYHHYYTTAGAVIIPAMLPPAAAGFPRRE
jgi:hypothetical protein